MLGTSLFFFVRAGNVCANNMAFNGIRAFALNDI